FHFLQPALSVRRVLLLPLLAPPQLVRVEPVQSRFGHEVLDLVGVDVRLAAAREAGTFGTGVAALAARTRARYEPFSAVATDQDSAKEIAPGGLVRAPLRIREQSADRRSILDTDDARPLRSRGDLPVVRTLAAYPRRGKHPAQTLRRPLTAHRGRHTSLVQV